MTSISIWKKIKKHFSRCCVVLVVVSNKFLFICLISWQFIPFNQQQQQQQKNIPKQKIKISKEYREKLKKKTWLSFVLFH